MAGVRCGSISEVGLRDRHVRFPPVSDRTADISGGPFRVESRCGAVALGRNICCRPFRLAVPHWFYHGSVSTSRSSNRTGLFQASGSRRKCHDVAHGKLLVLLVRQTRPSTLCRDSSGNRWVPGHNTLCLAHTSVSSIGRDNPFSQPLVRYYEEYDGAQIAPLIFRIAREAGHY